MIAVPGPAENMALTVARAQVERGENPPLNTTTMLVLALDRLTGRSDWTVQEAPEDDAEPPANPVEIADDLFESAHGWRPGGTP